MWGTTIETIDYFAINDKSRIIFDSIKTCPVGIEADNFNCYWSPMYKKEHFSHLLLITDIDIIKKKYNCVDVYYPAVGEIMLNFNEIEKICLKILLFHFPIKMSDCIKDAWLYLKKIMIVPNKNIYETEKNNMIDYLISISSDFVGNPLHLETSIFLINLKWIAEDKKNFLLGLNYLERRIGNQLFKPVHLLLIEVEKSVLLLKNLVAKYAITRINRIEKVKAVVEDMYQLNIDIAEKMSGILNQEDM